MQGSRLLPSSKVLVLSMKKLSKGSSASQGFKITFLALQEEEFSCDTEVALRSAVHMVSQQNNCRQRFLSLGGTWESTITFSHFIWKLPQLPLNRSAGSPSTICMSVKYCSKRQKQIKCIISVQEQGQTFHLLKAIKKTLTSSSSNYSPQIFPATCSVPFKHSFH